MFGKDYFYKSVEYVYMGYTSALTSACDMAPLTAEDQLMLPSNQYDLTCQSIFT